MDSLTQDDHRCALRIASRYGVNARDINVLYYFTKDYEIGDANHLSYKNVIYQSEYLGITYMKPVSRFWETESYPLEYSHCFRVIVPEKKKFPLKLCSITGSLYLNGKFCLTNLYFFDVFLFSKLWRLPWYCSLENVEDLTIFAYRSSHESYPKLVVPFIGKKTSELTKKQRERCYPAPAYTNAPIQYVLNTVNIKNTSKGNAFGLLVPFSLLRGSWYLENSDVSLPSRDPCLFIKMVVLNDSKIPKAKKMEASPFTKHPLDPPLLKADAMLYALHLCHSSVIADAKPVCQLSNEKIVYQESFSMTCKLPETLDEIEIQQTQLICHVNNHNTPIVLYELTASSSHSIQKKEIFSK